MRKSKKAVLPEQQNAIIENKKRDKRIVRTILITVFSALIVLGALAFGITLLQDSSKKTEEIIRQKDEVYPTLTPFPADFTTDIETIHEYTSLGTDIMYEYSDGSIFAIENLSENTKHEGHRFFENYFGILKKGEYEKYPDLFTESYTKTPLGFEKEPSRTFPPQKVYDILVEEIMRTKGSTGDYTYEGKKCAFGIYRVSYRIYRNDGYFRPDLYTENLIRPLIVELVTFGDGKDEMTFIKNIYTESSIVPDYGKEE